MICRFGAILAWKSDDDDAAADDDYNDDRKSDPYMSPSYAGDTKSDMICKLWRLKNIGNIVIPLSSSW